MLNEVVGVLLWRLLEWSLLVIVCAAVFVATTLLVFEGFCAIGQGAWLLLKAAAVTALAAAALGVDGLLFVAPALRRALAKVSRLPSTRRAHARALLLTRS